MDSREWTDTSDLWSPQGIHGHTNVWTADMRPVEPTRDPWTYSSMDGQPTRDLWTQLSCPLGLGTCHHVGQRGNQGWEI